MISSYLIVIRFWKEKKKSHLVLGFVERELDKYGRYLGFFLQGAVREKLSLIHLFIARKQFSSQLHLAAHHDEILFHFPFILQKTSFMHYISQLFAFLLALIVIPNLK